MKRDDFSLTLDFDDELIIDNFAGGGGTSEGLEQAFGRPVDIAINHDPYALAMHALNHPYTNHLCESVWDVNPIKVTRNRPVALVWLSPDCKHFSKAKGATPVAKHIRGLAWVGMRWAALTKPRVIMLENVEEFKDWGPLISRTVMVANEEGVEEEVIQWFPDPKKKGKTFQSFVRQLRAHGYVVDWREMRACDNGAPTIRNRLFMVARRDGLPIEWPEPTHGEPTDRAVLAGKLLPYRTAAECIDFSLPANSLWGRKRPLADNTMRRVAKGLWRHVLTSAKPFIVGAGGPAYSGKPVTSEQPFGALTAENHRAVVQPTVAPFIADQSRPQNAVTAPADDPLRTQCAQVKGGHFTLVSTELAPYVVTNTTGHSGASAECPLPTATTGNHHAVTAASLVPLAHGERRPGEERTADLDKPASTIHAGGGNLALTAASLAPLRGTSEGHMGGHPVDGPLSTMSAGGTHHALTAAHMTKFNTGSVGYSLHEPAATATAGGTPKRPSTGITQGVVGASLVTVGYGEREGQEPRTNAVEEPTNAAVAGSVKQALVAAHLVDMGHGESSSTGAKRWSHGHRTVEGPINAITASGVGSAVTAIHLNHLTHQGDRAGYTPDDQVPTVTGANRGEQAVIAAYCVKYYSSGGQWQDLAVPLHTLPTKGRMGLVEVIQVPLDCIAPEHRERAKLCAELLHKYLPEHFPEPADMVIIGEYVLVDITLRMLKAFELFLAQGFPKSYIINEIPDPAILFKDGKQAPGDPRLIPRIKLTGTAQVRMVGNSVSPMQAKALAMSNFTHERRIVRRTATC